MPADIEISPTLRVMDLEKELSFYRKYLNLEVNQHGTGDDGFEFVELGFAGRFKASEAPLLVLKHDPNAKEPPHDFAGLFHFAILVPDRKSLAYAYSALENSGMKFDGFADHLVSESLYLHDPESNGIEIYRDKPRNEWPHDEKGMIIMDTLPLDLRSLLVELEEVERIHAIPLPQGAKIGHIHLRVTNLEKSIQFYQHKLGFKMTVDWRRLGASFLAAGNYHHHIGLNIWHSSGGHPHMKQEAGLDMFTITVLNESLMHALASELRNGALTESKDGNELSVSDTDSIQILIR